jgi:hypothetical protein
MRMSRVIIVLGALAVLAAGASGAWAQSDYAQAKKQYDITQSVIEKARRLVQESGNPRAEEPLRRAIDIQGQARNQLERHGAAAVGMRLTLIAREYASRAAKLAGEPSENKDFVFRELQKTDEILRRVKDGLGDDETSRAADLVRSAFERQEQAESTFRRSQFRVALRMTYLARDLAQKSLDLTAGGAAADPDRVQRALERTDAVIAKAVEGLRGEKPPLLDEAVRLQERAGANFRDGRLGLALKLTLTARDLAGRALQSGSDDAGPGAILSEIEATRSFLDDAERAAQESGSEEALTLVREGYSHLEVAQEHLDKGEHVAARAQLKLARRKAERAMEVAGGQ